MISSGKIALISNKALNVKLTQWPGKLERYNYQQKILVSLNRDEWRGIMLNTFPFREHQYDVGFGSAGKSSFDYEQDKVLSSMAVESLAEMKRLTAELCLLRLSELQESQEEILQLIGEELEFIKN